MLAGLAVSLSMFLTLFALPADAAPFMEEFAGPRVSYPLRHDFSMAVGLPGHANNEPTSCYDGWDHEGYLCRIVSGYEDTGDRRNFLVHSEDALVDGYHESYGSTLVSRGGVQFEGCRQWRTGDWHCDYSSRKHVSSEHYDTSGTRFVLKVFWAWQEHTRGQFGCASAIAGYWGKYGRFIGVLKNCLNAPMERP